MSTRSRRLSVTVTAEGAARILQRRFKARDRYRRRRDRKIAVDWLGRDFEYQHRTEFGVLQPLLLKLVEYNPTNHMMKLMPTGRDHKVVGRVTWNTDDFWVMYRTGKVLHG